MIASGDDSDGGQFMANFHIGGSNAGEIRISGFTGMTDFGPTEKIPVLWQ